MKCAILLASNDDYSLSLVNVLFQIYEYSSKIKKSVFIYESMSEEIKKEIININILKDLDIKFIKYDLNFIGRFYKNIEIFSKIDSRYTHLIYSKFHLWDYIKDYDYAIWLDSDILLLDSIEHLFPTNAHLKWRKGANEPLYTILKDKKIYIDYKEANKPNGGIIAINCRKFDGLIDANLVRYSYNILNELLNIYLKSTVFSDEIPFGVIFHRYNLTYEELSPLGNVSPNLYKENFTTALHPVGGNFKFWNSYASFYTYQEWYQFYKKIPKSNIFNSSIENKILRIKNQYKRSDIFNILYLREFKDELISSLSHLNNFNFKNYDIIINPKGINKIFLYSLSFNFISAEISISIGADEKILYKLIIDVDNIDVDFFKNFDFFINKRKIKYEDKKFYLYTHNLNLLIEEYVNTLRFIFFYYENYNFFRSNYSCFYLKTFFDTFLSIKDFIICHDCQENIIRIIIFKELHKICLLHPQKYYLFIEQINFNSEISFSNKIIFFDYISDLSNKICIRVNNLFLSARKMVSFLL